MCKDDDFLAIKANENLKFCTGQLRQVGLFVVAIKHWLFVLQQPILIGWDCNVAFNKLLCEGNYFLIVSLMGMKYVSCDMS